jgi:hypothetical protein
MVELFDNKTKYSYLGQSLMAVLLVFIASSAADRLSGKFFPADSPIFANFYANDFLPGGVFTFLVLGWMVIDFVCRRYRGNPRLGLIAILIVIIGISFMFFTKLKLQDIQLQSSAQVLWAFYLESLIDVWSFAWMIGGMSAFGVNVILPKRIAHD